MNDSPAQLAARARAQRRKRMQQRQTVIFGTIIAILLGAALFAGAVWAGIVPAPVNIQVKEPEAQEASMATQPCPPPDAHPVDFEDITVNVLNSTSTSGLGARTADAIREHGLNVESVDNASDLYLGSAKILVGVEYIDIAYTVGDLIPDSQIVVDARTESLVDIILGSGFTEVNSQDELSLDPKEPIPAPEGCVDAEDLQDPDEAADEDLADDEEPADEEEGE